MSARRIILFAGICALLLGGYYLLATPGRIFSHYKPIELSDKVGKDIEVTLTYDTGSRGAPTFIVHAKNVSGHILGIRQFLRYYTRDDRSNIERGEVSFLICLGKPGNAVPLNTYSTGAVNDGFATPIKAGEEQTFEYQMKPGDRARIGSNEVIACVSYYDLDPMQARDPNQSPPPLLAAWSNTLKVEPLQWGLVDNGLQVGLQIKKGVVTVQARNVSDQPLQVMPPEDENSGIRNAFYFFIVLQYSGMYAPLYQEQIPTRRYRHEPLTLDPGQVMTGTYTLTADDLQKLKGAQLMARMHFISPIRKYGPAADSNAIAAPQ